jgi:crossover junction endodeoxyribonuclease RuvC
LRILGLDPGSYATGYGVVDQTGAGLEEIDSGAIHPPREDPFLRRLSEIHEALTELLLRFRPDEVAVENPFHARNSKIAIQLGHARAAALLPAVKAGVPVFEYAPREVKLAVTGHGQAEKSQVAKMVAVLLGRSRPADSSDASDALAVAICHAHRQAGMRRLKKHPA